MRVVPVQRRHVLLAQCAASPDPQPVRAWASGLFRPVEFLPVLSRSLEYGDEPRSRFAMDSAFLHALRLVGRWGAEAEDGLLVVDATGLREDQLNRMANVLRRAGTPCSRVALEFDPGQRPLVEDEFPRLIDFRHVGPGEDGRSIAVVGDVHGCSEELDDLLALLGRERGPWGDYVRTGGPDLLVFAGDLVDRGPDPLGCIRRVKGLVRSGDALCVMGNHDEHLLRFLRGDRVTRAHGMGATQDAMAEVASEERASIASFLERLPHQLVLDGGRLVVAHAGCPSRHVGMDTEQARKECVYGTMLARDEDGLPVRLDWAAEDRGEAAVVQGHVPSARADASARVVCVDTGCAFGGSLTALLWPSRELVSVPARRDHTEGHPTALRLARELGSLPSP